MRMSQPKTIMIGKLCSFLFIFFLLLSSCKKKDYTARVMPESMGTYVYAYTSGVISRGDVVKIRFNAPIVDDGDIGGVIEKGLLNISPSINGEAKWEDDRTISFTPDAYFDPSQQYKGIVAVHRIFENVPDDVKEFEFNFRTKEQFFNVEIDGLNATSNDDLTQQEIIGNIYFTDVVELDKAKKVINARQRGSNLPIEFIQGNKPTDYQFIISNVSRGNGSSAVDVSWNGKSIGVAEKGNKEIEVPALGDFKVVNARVIKQGDPHLLLTFSDPLQSDQSLIGMMKVANYSGILRYVIDGNQVKVFPKNKLEGDKSITVYGGIKNAAGVEMSDPSVWSFKFDETMPTISLVGRGVIMPESEGLIFPFEAVNLNAVEVEIFKIFENNLLQFLQTNDWDGDYQLNRVGRIVHREKVDLGKLNPDADKTKMSRYALDLQHLIKREPGAIYQIRLGFLPGYSDFYCGDNPKNGENLTQLQDEKDLDDESIMTYYYGPDGYYDDYSYRDKRDPCKPAYYNYNRFVKRNVFASNLGLVAKKGNDGSIFVAVNDLRTTDEVVSATVKAYDYQQQLLGSTTTDGTGVAQLITDREPYFLVVESGEERGYLKINDGNSLSLSRFDVSGSVTQKGIKGFIYGERGVWRPGDTLYLNFVMEDKMDKIPDSHPVAMEIYDSRGQLQDKIITRENSGGIYSFTTNTTPASPTGNWMAKVKVGGAVFSKSLKIETVKPNRLKINLDFGKDELMYSDGEARGELQSMWLHGAPAGNLKAKVEMQFRQKKTTFNKFKDFAFDDPARKFSSEPIVVFDGNLDKDGKADVKVKLEAKGSSPGKLKIGVKSRVFEKSGDFSTDNFSIDYSPYDTYAGVYIPKNKYGEKRLDYGKTSTIEVAALTPDGRVASNRNLKVGLYRMEWSWWWDADEEDYTSYNSSTHYGAISKSEATTNSKGLAEVDLEVARWGRYLVRVCDEESGHCSGDIFYAGYPWNDDDGQNNKAATMLMFSSDKLEYNVGESVQLEIPASEVARGLLTIENGSRVLESRWFNVVKGENKISVKTQSAWAPNVYAHVTLTQPHAQTENDLPIRMYGVIPIKVVDPKTQLEPEIKMADKLRPEEEFMVEVKEKNGKPMSYTLAVVDEGLLDLTRFGTPDPWNVFYAREALGVKTWDMYDQVLGAYGGDLERILSVGGGGEIRKKKSGEQAQRFKPVVKHLGPFYLAGGKKASHKITMPNYVGSVRTMVVAAHQGAYGNAEATTPVKKPLMVLATLPRVLGPGESLKLPVNVFAMERNIKNVTVTVESNDILQWPNGKTQTITFSKPGDQIVEFDMKVMENIGIGKVKVTATNGVETATHEIELDVRNPNPMVTNVYSSVVDAGETWEKSYAPLGMEGTNEGILEISNIPPMNLGERMNYLIRYPHGCIEQTTSSGFPQLYVSKLLDLNEKQKKEVPGNIQATLERLKLFQVSSGGFSYWPGGNEASEWGTNYGGHFMLEAQKLGYVIPIGMLDKWVRQQQRFSKDWEFDDGGFHDHGHYNNNDLMQAYRLFTLALAGKPDKGAMNRMRNTKGISPQSKWRLAAAYGITGNTDVARQIINGLDTEVEDYAELGYTYGSGIRDRAMMLETLVSISERKKGAELVTAISEGLSESRWYSTQSVAYALLAVGKFVGGNELGEAFSFTYAIDGNKVNGGSSTPVFNVDVPMETKERKLEFKNTSSGILYAKLILQGIPVKGDTTSASNNLIVKIRYMDKEGRTLNPRTLKQGTDFMAEVTVKNPSTTKRKYDEMALTQIFPSGWEITNSRMDDIEGVSSTKPEYQDIRDDRVYTYFDIGSGATHKYVIQLNAAYQGRFYLPSISCEAMYDNSISARQPGGWVEVVKDKEI